MKYNQLEVKSNKSTNRVGRGISAGQGKTAGRGTKGQNARTGGGTRPGFEGGQTPLYMRVPKLPGFRSLKPKSYEVKTGSLNIFTGTVSNKELYEAGLIGDAYSNVKIISGGDLTKKLNVSLQGATKSSVALIEKAGGKFTVIDRPKRTSSKKEK